MPTLAASITQPESARHDAWLGGARLRRRALGQYFTPPEVAAFALRTVRAAAGAAMGRTPRLIDPACGEGVFLLAALEQDRSWQPNVVGLDLDAELAEHWRISGLAARATLRLADGLRDLPADGISGGAFDLVVGNPPYGGLGLQAPGDVAARFEAVLEQYDCWRLGTEWEPGRVACLPHSKTARARARRRLERFPVELLFVERFLQLARPGGWLAMVLPDGALANPRLQLFRDWLLPRVTPRAVVSLPRSIFGGAGSHTAILVGQKTDGERHWALGGGRWDRGVGRWALGVGPGEEEGAADTCDPKASVRKVPLTAPAASAGVDLDTYLAEAEAYVSSVGDAGETSAAVSDSPGHPFSVGSPSAQARFTGSVVVARERMLRAAPREAELWGRPWSPQYWDPEVAEVLERLERTAFPLQPLGRRDQDGRDVGFLRYTTYGAVGSRSFEPFGVRYLTPRNLTPTGVDPSRRERFVTPGGHNDPARSRLLSGDILLSNSGVASLGRPALFLGEGACNISQHLNLIRVDGIDACYVTAYLHTEFGRTQMRRLYSGTGAAGLSYDDIRAIRIPVLPQHDQAQVRRAFLEMHAAHEAAMRLRPTVNDADGGKSESYEQQLARAGTQLAALVAALEAYFAVPSPSGLTIDRGSVSMSGPLRLTATVCSE
jgi:N-6 DNA Methylase